MSLPEHYDEGSPFSFIISNTPSVHNSRIKDVSNSKNNPPIFKRHKIDFRPDDVITHIAVNSNQMILVMRNKKLLKIDLLNPDQPTEIDLALHLGSKSQLAKLYQIFFSPDGKHALLSFVSDLKNLVPFENLFLSKKIHIPSNLKSHLITAVGWNFQVEKSNSTGSILVATNKGLVFEVEFATDESKWLMGPSIERMFHQFYDIGLETGPITGIHFHRLDHLADSVYFVLLTTPSRLYQCVAKTTINESSVTLTHIFNTSDWQLKDVPGNLGFSKLDFKMSSNSPPEFFGWLTEPGILYGPICYDPSVSINTVVNQTSLITYHKNTSYNHSLTTISDIPIGMVVTKFHVLVLFKHLLRVICILSEEIVMEDKFDESCGAVAGIAKDLVKGTIWIYFELAVFRYKITEEDRNIWKIHLAKKDFINARRFSKNDPVKINQVICEEAQFYFESKDYVKAAELYAQSEKGVEEIGLKFMQINHEDALQKFLTCKLESSLTKDESQISLLAIWLIELIIHRLGKAKADGSSTDYELYRLDFEKLIFKNPIKDCLIKNKDVVYDIILTQGDEECLILFASSIQDYSFSLDYFYERENFEKCLQILREQASSDLTYHYAPLLMRKAPRETCQILINQCLSFDPDLLLPTLIQGIDNNSLTSPQSKEIVKYLEHCVTMGITKKIVHNCLVSLYAALDHPKLLDYLETRNDAGRVFYDIDYALEICSSKDLKKACVILYTIKEDYQNAVDIALLVDMDLAKKTANLPQMNDDLKRELWLKIACKLVEENKDVARVSQLLNECSLLKIEDILPFFPDFTVIDHFKDAICSSLGDYIQNLKDSSQDIDEVTDNVQHISNELFSLRERFISVKEDDKCAICSHFILGQPFHAFPCRHMYHSDCLFTEVQNYIGPTILERLRRLRSDLLLSQREEETRTVDVCEEVETEQIKDLMRSQCLYCGDLMIESINSPLVTYEEQNVAVTGW